MCCFVFEFSGGTFTFDRKLSESFGRRRNSTFDVGQARDRKFKVRSRNTARTLHLQMSEFGQISRNRNKTPLRSGGSSSLFPDNHFEKSAGQLDPVALSDFRTHFELGRVRIPGDGAGLVRPRLWYPVRQRVQQPQDHPLRSPQESRSRLQDRQLKQLMKR